MRRKESPMAQVKKAHCPAPGAVATACRTHAATQPQSLAKAGAVLIAEGLALPSGGQTGCVPKLVEACRRKYLRMGDAISTHIPAAVREQARQLKRHAPCVIPGNSIWKRFWAA